MVPVVSGYSQSQNLKFGAKFRVYARLAYNTPDKLEPVLLQGIQATPEPFAQGGFEATSMRELKGSYFVPKASSVFILERPIGQVHVQGANCADQYIVRDPGADLKRKNFFPRIELVTHVIDVDNAPRDRAEAIKAIQQGELFQIEMVRPKKYAGIYEYDVLTGEDLDLENGPKLRKLSVTG